MRFTWGALALIIVDGWLQFSGTVTFTPTVWLVLAVTLAGAIAADLYHRRGPGEPVQPEAAPQSPVFSLTH